MRSATRLLSLRARLVLLFTAGSTLVIVAAAAFLYLAIDRSLLGAIDDGLRARASDLEAILRDQDTADFPTQDPFAQVISLDGVVIAASPTSASDLAVLTPDELRARSPSGAIEREVPVLGGDARLLVRQVVIGGAPHVLVVGAPLDQYQSTQQRLVLVLLVGGPMLVALLALAGWLLAGAALRPVGRMAETAAEISIVDLSRRLEVPRAEDEIAHLARTLNRMLDRVEQAIRHERRFIDDASHELRTPLTILRGELELALGDESDHEAMVAAARSSLDEVQRLSRLSDDLLVLARARAGELQIRASVVDLASSARKVCDLLALGARPEVELHCTGAPVSLLADPDRIDQILLNLVANSLRFAHEQVEVRVGEASQPGGSARGAPGVELLVADDGDGFAAALLPVTFERFRRDDPSRHRGTGGAGLGLAIAAELTRAHGGTISAGNGAPLGGAWVRVWLPRQVREPAPGNAGGGPPDDRAPAGHGLG